MSVDDPNGSRVEQVERHLREGERTPADLVGDTRGGEARGLALQAAQAAQPVGQQRRP